MSWDLTLGDYIGVELPFTEPPEIVIPLDVQVDFPDASPMGVYVFPALYYELYGPGIDPAPRLVSQNGALGGTINIEPGALKTRIYLRYSAQPGALGTLPHGDIRKSLLTVRPGSGASIPSLGERVHQLILDVSATRITCIDGTTLNVPFITSYTDLEPVVTFESFVYRNFNANYWTKFTLTEPPVTDLGLRVAGYSGNSSLTPATRNNSVTAAGVAGTYHYHHIILGASNGTITGNGYTFTQDSNGVITPCVLVPGTTTIQHLIPAGTVAIFQKGVSSTGTLDTFMADIANNPVGHNYFRYQLEEVNTPQAYRGKNWRIPVYTFMHSFFAGREVTAAPWFGEITDYGL